MNETMKTYTTIRGLLREFLKVLPDTNVHDEHDPSWDNAWNELSDEAQELVKSTRTNVERTIKTLTDFL